MKKIILSVMVVLSLTTLAGCGNKNSDVQASSESPQTQSETQSQVSDISYEDNIDGLVKYMSDKGYISGNATNMTADIIGAKSGYRYQTKYNNSDVIIEIYEYDLNDINEDAYEIMNQVKANGSFTIRDIEIPVVISDTGKYLMIYEDASNKQDNIDRKNQIIGDFKSFKA